MAAVNYTSIHDLLPKKPPAMPVLSKNPNTKNHQPPPATKENEPFAKTQEAITYEEPLENQIDKDVKPFVDVRKEKIEISDELRKIGLEAVDPSMFKDAQNIKLPLSDDKIAVGLHAPVNSAFRWLATFALYLLKQSHMTLKTVHGKVIRIIQK